MDQVKVSQVIAVSCKNFTCYFVGFHPTVLHAFFFFFLASSRLLIWRVVLLLVSKLQSDEYRFMYFLFYFLPD